MLNYKLIGLFVFFQVCSFSFGSNRANEAFQKKDSIISNETDLGFYNAVDSKEFITKEIIYDAPKSGIVNFVWYSEDFSKEKLFTWNKNAKVIKNTVFSSMLKNNLGQFKVLITMPKHSKIYYGFWITKDKSGVYQDLWDWRKGNITFNNDEKQTFQAVYSHGEKSNISFLVSKGWIVFLSLSVILLIIMLLKGFWFSKVKKTSYYKEVILLGLALFLFHVLARCEIIKLHPQALFKDWENIVILFKASFWDLVYTVSLVLIFVIAFLSVKKNRYRNHILWLFKVIVFLTALYAFINITNVELLGHPFNYEWFYYSDFLGSEDSINAIKEHLTLFSIFNLLVIAISVFLLKEILGYVITIVGIRKFIKYPSYLIVFLLLVFLVSSSFRLNKKFIKGRVENAILAMGTSVINNNKSASFFSLPIDENESFVPNEGTSFGIETHTKEKLIKNVIFIVLESSGAKYFDAYGGKYKITPNLNSYAENAILYKNAYAHVPATMKSMVSLLGAIYPYISFKGITSENPNFKHPTLPSILKDQGYQTSFFTSADLSYMQGKEFLRSRSFDSVEDFSQIDCGSNFKQDIYNKGDAIDDFCLTNRFEIWLKNIPTGNFFSTIWTVQGHYPYFFSQVEEDFEVDNVYFNRYLNTIKHSDQMIGNIIQVLKEKELFESTLIVVTGDHGEAFNQHNNHGHASNIYEENIKIPLYFINPILFHGVQREDIVSMKDIASTTLALLDIELPSTWHGRDLISTYHDEVFFFAPFSDYLFGYIKGNKKFIFNETTNSVQVFDLRQDPNEKINISHKIPKSEIIHAKKRIAAWVQYQDKFVNENLLN